MINGILLALVEMGLVVMDGGGVVVVVVVLIVVVGIDHAQKGAETQCLLRFLE